MNGKIPSNYEESKDWLPAYNASEEDIPPHHPCVIFQSATVRDRAGVRLPRDVVPVLSLARYEQGLGNVSNVPENESHRPIVVNGSSTLPAGGWGKVSRDWPLYAFVEGETDFLSRIVSRPVYPSSSGFRVAKGSIADTRYYWRRQLSYSILRFPGEEDAKSGLCQVMEVQRFDQTPLRLLSFRIPEVSLPAGSGFVRLGAVPDQVYSQAVVSLVDNRFGFYSLGTYELHLSLQVQGVLASGSSTVVPFGSITIATEGYNQLDPVGIEDVQAVRSYSALISRVSHAGGAYDCADVVFDYVAPKELFTWDDSFVIDYDNDQLPGFQDRRLFATMDVFGAWSSGTTPQIASATISGWGHVVLRSERRQF